MENPVKKWKLPPVSIRTFIEDPYFLGIGEETYPEIKNICEEIVEGNYLEAVEVAGIGSGKSFSSEIMCCYSAYLLLCMRNPHKYYGLAPDKDIVIMNMGINATQALEVVFNGIKGLMEKSPFFQEFSPKMISGRIEFEANKVKLISGNSKSTTPLGYNIFAAVLDEAAFYLDNDNKSVAEDIYTGLQRRVVSRFGNDGLVMVISSPRYKGDFIMKKLKESKTVNSVFGIQLPTWKVKPLSRYTGKGMFYFNPQSGIIKEDKPETEMISKFVDKKFDATLNWWEIPMEFHDSFKQNPEKAKRDFAAVPSLVIEGFFPDPDRVAKVFDPERPDPVIADGKYQLNKEATRNPYYIHIDLALNRKGGDFAGLCMAHADGFVEDEKTGEKRAKVYVDLVERIGAGPTGEIEFEDVRNRIYELKKLGYSIKLVTFDQFQSKDSQQILRRKGIRSAQLSVDRTMEPYNTLKEVIYTDRISIHQQDKLQEELCNLEVIKGRKVDHPQHSSKDMSDALCGAVYNVISNTSVNSLGVINADWDSKGQQENQTPTGQTKTEYYEMLEEMNKQGYFNQ